MPRRDSGKRYCVNSPGCGPPTFLSFERSKHSGGGGGGGVGDGVSDELAHDVEPLAEPRDEPRAALRHAARARDGLAPN